MRKLVKFQLNKTTTILMIVFFIESLKAICESFIVAMDICGLPPVPYKHGQTLDRRKSKVVNTSTSSSNIYLDIVGLPQMTRNVSETQLLALKNVGKYVIGVFYQFINELNKTNRF